MKYRQWKKNYKKRYGTNPPLELDKHKQRRLAKRVIKQIRYFMEFVADATRAVITAYVAAKKEIGKK